MFKMSGALSYQSFDLKRAAARQPGGTFDVVICFAGLLANGQRVLKGHMQFKHFDAHAWKGGTHLGAV